VHGVRLDIIEPGQERPIRETNFSGKGKEVRRNANFKALK